MRFSKVACLVWANLVLLLLGSALVLYAGDSSLQRSSLAGIGKKSIFGLGFDSRKNDNSIKSLVADRRATEAVLRQLSDLDAYESRYQKRIMEFVNDREDRIDHSATYQTQVRAKVKIVERWEDHGVVYSLAMLDLDAMQGERVESHQDNILTVIGKRAMKPDTERSICMLMD
jgi:hypothetical protein